MIHYEPGTPWARGSNPEPRIKQRVVYTSEVPKGMTPRQRKKFVRKIRVKEAEASVKLMTLSDLLQEQKVSP